MRLNLYQYEEFCRLNQDATVLRGKWISHFYAGFALRERMTRGLYCLGFEDEGVLAELNHPLTAHEKLALRLAMPREFWPQTWLDEIGESD